MPQNTVLGFGSCRADKLWNPQAGPESLLSCALTLQVLRLSFSVCKGESVASEVDGVLGLAGRVKYITDCRAGVGVTRPWRAAPPLVVPFVTASPRIHALCVWICTCFHERLCWIKTGHKTPTATNPSPLL